jgi:rare lipoprotein A
MGRRGLQGRGITQVCVVAALSLTLAHCGKSNIDPRYGVAASPRVVEPGQPVPKGGGTYRVGNPYVVAGRTYVPEENNGYLAEGLASWYGDAFHGRQTANGEVFDMHSLSAAHPTLPLPSYVRVTNLRNKRSIIVRVNDRGPYHADRVIDLSVRAAKLLGFHENGVARVRVEYVGRASLTGSDDTKLAATLRHGTPAPAPSEVRVASAKPFIPEYFDPTPISRGPVPTPPERPYELGQDEPPARVARRAPEVSAVARAPAPRPQLATATPQPTAAPNRPAAVETMASFDSRFGPAAAMPSATVNSGPLSAYAPRSEGAVMTGRGLY